MKKIIFPLLFSAIHLTLSIAMLVKLSVSEWIPLFFMSLIENFLFSIAIFQLKPRRDNILPIIFAVYYFFAYICKFFLSFFLPSVRLLFLENRFFITPQIFADAKLLAIILLVAFLGSFNITKLYREKNILPLRQSFTKIGIAKFWYYLYLTFVLGVIILSTFILLRFNIFQGSSQTDLPGRLEGLLIYIRVIFIPMCLFFLYLIDIKRKKSLMITSILLLGYAFSETYIRTTKSMFLPIFIGMFYLFFSFNKIKKSVIFPLLMVFIITPTIFDFASSLRVERVSEGQVTRISSTPVQTLENLFDRMIGIDMLLAFKEFSVDPLYEYSLNVVLKNRGVAGEMTVYAFGFSESSIDSFGAAPSFPGFFYYLGGPVCVFFGCLLVLLVFFIIGQRYLTRSSPNNTLTFLGIILFFIAVISDGVVDRAFSNLLPVYFLTLVFLRVAYRKIVRENPNENPIVKESRNENLILSL